MLNPNLEDDRLESLNFATQSMTTSAQFAAGIGWEIYFAGIRDCRRVNPLFDAWCSFAFPLIVPWVPPEVSNWDRYHGNHLALVREAKRA